MTEAATARSMKHPSFYLKVGLLSCRILKYGKRLQFFLAKESASVFLFILFVNQTGKLQPVVQTAPVDEVIAMKGDW